jgi:hypothetical protein
MIDASPAMSPFLRVLENEVQIAALTFLGVVYVAKLVWLFRFPSRRERTFRAGSEGAGVALAMAGVFTPWRMESTRSKPLFYAQFALFHLGVAAAILLSFLIPYAPRLIELPGAAPALLAVLTAASAVGAARIVRRLRRPSLRLISTVDDYLSVSLTLAFFVSVAVALALRRSAAEWPFVLFFTLTAVFLVYVPFSKICHYLYYPFTRFFLGRTLGHRGVLAPTRERTQDIHG